MPTHSPLSSELRDLFRSESSRIQQHFSATKDGLNFLQQRSTLVDSIVLRLWEQFVCSDKSGPPGYALVAFGDFGRRSLFPYSEIHLLILHAAENATEKFIDSARRFSTQLEDFSLKLNVTTKAFSEYAQFNSDHPELILSTPDSRYLAGDPNLFASLHDRLIPEMMARESQVLVGHLAEITRTRHRKFGNTIFHLEPNVKDGLGGYTDYALACWLALMSGMEKEHDWPSPNSVLPPNVQNTLDSAFQFLASVRCFLHFRNGRDDSVLTWAAQDEAVTQKIGAPGIDVANSVEWMRIYFGHARAIDRISGQLLEEMPAAHSLFYRQMETWRSGFSDEDFSVVDGLIFLQRPENLADPQLLFRTIRLIAQHGFKLSPTAEHQLAQARPLLATHLPKSDDFWRFLQDILPNSHAAEALRAMHS